MTHRSSALGAGALLLLGLSGDGVAQAGTPGAPGSRRPPARNQVAIDAGPVAALGVSYARRIGESRFMGGLGLGFAWEWNEHTFTRQVWEAVHVDPFFRYVFRGVLHADFGLSYLHFVPTDDTDERGSFIGPFVSLSAGYRFVFAGAALRAGWVSGDVPSEGGVIFTVHVRGVIPWGR